MTKPRRFRNSTRRLQRTYDAIHEVIERLNVSNELTDCIDKGNELLIQSDRLMLVHQRFQNELDCCERAKLLIQDLSQLRSELKNISVGIAYFRCVRFFFEYTSQLSSLCNKVAKSPEDIHQAKQMVVIYSLLHIELNKLRNPKTTCSSVIKYGDRVVERQCFEQTWNTLKLVIGNELSNIGYPVQSALSPIEPADQTYHNLIEILKLSRELYLPSQMEAVDVECNAGLNLQNELTLLVIRKIFLETIMDILSRKYRFNFATSNRPTNRLDKPEWLFAQVINWFTANEKFVDLIGERCRYSGGDLRLVFCQLMCKMISSKVHSDLLFLTKEANRHLNLILYHYIDQLFSFGCNIHSLVKSYVPLSPLFLQVCGDDSVFDVVWAILKLRSMESIRIVFKSTDSDLGELCICLLTSIVVRMKMMPCASVQLKFINLMKEVVDEIAILLTDPANMKVVWTILYLKCLNEVLEFVETFKHSIDYTRLLVLQHEFDGFLKGQEPSRDLTTAFDLKFLAESTLSHEIEAANLKSIDVGESELERSNRFLFNSLSQSLFAYFKLSGFDEFKRLVKEELIANARTRNIVVRKTLQCVDTHLYEHTILNQKFTDDQVSELKASVEAFLAELGQTGSLVKTREAIDVLMTPTELAQRLTWCQPDNEEILSIVEEKNITALSKDEVLVVLGLKGV
ncbi:hypothetical protein ACOME3_006713 [Neoechinorhynchus agilis]